MKKIVSDWNQFLDELIGHLDRGLTEQEVSAIYRGGSVTWKGEITKISLDESYVPGISMNMGDELLPIPGGRVLRSDHIALRIDKIYSDPWRQCKVGDCVSFSAQVPKKSGPFAEVRFSVFDADPEVILMLGLVNCKLLEIH